MAVTVNTIYSRDTVRIFEVIASADADTTATIAHGLADAPRVVWAVPILAAARISLWIVSAIDATNVTLLKAITVGSGDPGAQVRVFVARAAAFLAGASATPGGFPGRLTN